jgi:hypothetical protein
MRERLGDAGTGTRRVGVLAALLYGLRMIFYLK